jgi:outer membrane protein insertion porin family
MPRTKIFQTSLLSVRLLSFFLATLVLGHAASGEQEADTASVSAPIVSSILVDVRDVAGRETDWLAMAQSLIFLREGEPFSEARLQESIEALKVSGKFGEIHVDSKKEDKGISLQFQLTPFRLIKEIKIHGKYPLFEREILNAMTIYTGDVFIEGELPKQAALVAEVFQQEGFIAPKVEVAAREDPEDGHFIIRVDIEKGAYYKLGRLEISGNRAFSDTRLKLKMKTWRVSFLPGSAGAFSDGNLKKDITHLTEYYWGKGYPEAAVDVKVEKESGTNGVSVFVKIDEGRRYAIQFVGNDEFWDRTLKQDLVFFREGNKKDIELKKSARKVKERYRMAGYLETRVKIEEETKIHEDQKVRRLRFVIDEGPRAVVHAIQMSGNHAFDDDKLKKQMLTRLPGFLDKGVFVPERLDEDVYAITSLYRRHGYSEARVSEDLTWSKDKRDVSIKLDIEEGIQSMVSSLKITGITVVSEEEADRVIMLKEGEPFRKYMVQSDENALSALISEKGYPHVKVKGEVSSGEDPSKVQIVYSVNEGQQVKMGQVYYTGNFRTKEKILQKELNMPPGEPFSLVQLLKGQRNIRNMGLFDRVQFKTIGLKEQKEEINLFVEMEEKKPYFVESGVGYETDTGLFVSAKVGDHNLFGTNKAAWLDGKWSEIGYSGELGLLEPRLFGTQTSATFGLFAERREEFNQNFGTRVYGASLGFSRQAFRHVGVGLNFRFEGRDQFRTDSRENAFDVDDRDEFEPRSILVTTPSIRYDTRDSFIHPKKGIFSSLSVDISKGLSNALDDFLKYRFDFRYYITPLRRLTFAWLGRAGYIDPFNEEEAVPDDQLFFLGGISDVRGFDENLLRFDRNGDPVGGRTALVGSLEARIDLGLNLELAAFYDVGRLTDTFVDADVSDPLRASVGLGLRYMTPIGPIGFLYGRKLDPEEGESPGRLHFSVGYTF